VRFPYHPESPSLTRASIRVLLLMLPAAWLLREYAANLFLTKLASIMREDQADMIKEILPNASSLFFEPIKAHFDERQREDIDELELLLNCYLDVYHEARKKWLPQDS
jgi:hypothetical protein